MTDRQAEQWVAVANSALKECMDEGGTDESCAPGAIRQANGVVAAHALAWHRAPAGNYTIREETLQGRKHLVVPVVMMTEGVHRGSHGPILHLAEELGKFPGAWDGIPVCVNHPSDGDGHVSANSPGIIDEWVIGRVFNTQMDGKKLRAEAWLDPELLARMSPEALEAIGKGLPMDVSVGVFTDEDMQVGDWNGERYVAVARNHRPDHLALLPGGTGACSWSDGCGVRAYQGDQMINKIQTNAIKFKGTESIPWSKPTLADFGMEGNWQSMSQEDKAKVAGHFLIGDDSASNYGELMFPVVNPKTGRLNENALRAVIGGRGAQANITASQRVSARRQAYRLLNSEFDAELEIPSTLAADITAHEGLKDLALLGLAINAMGYRETADAIQRKLDRMDDPPDKIHYLEDCYEDYFIYRIGRLGTPDQIFKRNYTVAQDGTVEFTGEAIPVIKRVSYDPTSQQGGMHNMSKEKQPCCEAKVQMLIESGLYQEADRDRLMAMEEADINILSASVERAQAQVNEQKDKVKELEANAAKDQTRERAIQTLTADLGDQAKLMAILPPETRNVISHGLRLYQDERNGKIARILAHTVEGVYTKEVLEAMDDQMLDTLSRAIKVPQDYSGLAPTIQGDGNGGPQGYEAEANYPPEVEFKEKQA